MADQSIANVMLEQARQGFIDDVPPEKKQEYDSFVTAGMRVMLDPKTSKFMSDRLARSNGDIVAAVSTGMADLMVMLYHQSKQALTADMAIRVAFNLMTHALEIAEQSGDAQISKEVLEQCTQSTASAVAQKFGITKEQIDEAIAKAEQGGDQPPQHAVPQVQGVPATKAGGLLNATQGA